MPGLGRERGQQITALAHLSSAGLAFGLAVLFGAALGYGLDKLAGTSPWGFLGGFLLGLVAGILNVFRAAGVWSSSRPQ
jgi:F0F1-type ATP synthase assembly protein I